MDALESGSQVLGRPGEAPIALVVDDDESIGRLLAAVLARAGYSCVVASDGAEALSAAAAARVSGGTHAGVATASVLVGDLRQRQAELGWSAYCGRIELAWQPSPAAVVVEYRVYRPVAPYEDRGLVGTRDGNGRSCSDAAAVPDTEYRIGLPLGAFAARSQRRVRSPWRRFCRTREGPSHRGRTAPGSVAHARHIGEPP